MFSTDILALVWNLKPRLFVILRSAGLRAYGPGHARTKSSPVANNMQLLASSALQPVAALEN
jgi:hypothetical protein